jgi:hypothetical protein
MKSEIFNVLNFEEGVKPVDLKLFLTAIIGQKYAWMVDQNVDNEEGEYGGLNYQHKFKFKSERKIRRASNYFKIMNESRQQYVKLVISHKH